MGSAIRYGFEKLGHNVKIHDTVLSTSLSDVLDTEVCYICVPTPSKEDGACDTSIVEQVVSQLSFKKYKGIVAVKSTVSPGTTQSLMEQFSDLVI